ncbi:unnamed protein product [Heterotrigona itama]|uniref:Uncharacterized protein n=1 Tax=Heterotrigona itama TaxID=395501 RepID=A0A6V7H805_9HYME|nr:unnamed protein product [Heterotrigona itama]
MKVKKVSRMRPTRKQTSATGARNGPAGFVDLVGRVTSNDGTPLCRNDSFADFQIVTRIVDSSSISNELLCGFFTTAQCEEDVLASFVILLLKVYKASDMAFLTTFFPGNTKLANQQGRVPDPIKHGNLTRTDLDRSICPSGRTKGNI